MTQLYAVHEHNPGKYLRPALPLYGWRSEVIAYFRRKSDYMLTVAYRLGGAVASPDNFSRNHGGVNDMMPDDPVLERLWRNVPKLRLEEALVRYTVVACHTLYSYVGRDQNNLECASTTLTSATR